MVRRLRWLCGLEFDALRGVFTERERAEAIRLMRQGLPASILEQHNQMVRRGRRSIVALKGNRCPACRVVLPAACLARLRSGKEIELCDRCGVFLHLAGGEPE